MYTYIPRTHAQVGGCECKRVVEAMLSSWAGMGAVGEYSSHYRLVLTDDGYATTTWSGCCAKQVRRRDDAVPYWSECVFPHPAHLSQTDVQALAFLVHHLTKPLRRLASKATWTAIKRLTIA